MNINSTLTTWMSPSCTQTAGIKSFFDPKNESTLAKRLVKDRSRKSGSIPERTLIKLAQHVLRRSPNLEIGRAVGGCGLFATNDLLLKYWECLVEQNVTAAYVIHEAEQLGVG